MEATILEQRILEMPDKIANQSRLIMERALEIELERKEIEQIKAKYLAFKALLAIAGVGK